MDFVDLLLGPKLSGKQKHDAESPKLLKTFNFGLLTIGLKL